VLQAVWVNDGSGMIIAAAEESVSQIQLWFAPYPSGEIQRITNDSNDYVSISLTENSKELVAIQKNRQKAIWVAPNADANQARQVATAVGNTYGLAWASPARMIYSTMASGKLDLWSISADGNGRTQLTANAGSNYHPAVSADGHFIVFASNRTGTFNIWRMDADGSNPKQLTSGGSDFYPDISPDSRWVVYQSGGGASGKPTLWKVPIDGSGQPAQLTDLNTSVPAISPDGKWIACRFWDESDSSKKVAIVSFAGGAPTKTFAIPIHDWQRIRWTADAGALTYVDIRGGVSNIWKQPVDGRPASQLTFFKADQIFSYDWSDDGKLLACERGLETTDVVVISTYK
jgi:Tol biopolymer transport system component